MEVNNLGIAGISTKEYLDFILKNNLIKNIGKKVILFAGTNDIVIDNWNKDYTLKWINDIIQILKRMNKAVQISLIEVPKVLSRMDRANSVIIELNKYLESNLDKSINFIKLGSDFEDKLGSLKIDYTYDGLHFNENGYKKLKEIIEKEI
ncbi:GDSL-type esterase/lipase family protein [Cetobacterium sp.]|uniref:GDSL-type esterase/lipase family protein n=1 Tax=Cetobacterium sp. TaxID=2071632 RepID=UPI003F36075B